jgi:hypothetical protein
MIAIPFGGFNSFETMYKKFSTSNSDWQDSLSYLINDPIFLIFKLKLYYSKYCLLVKNN